MFLPTRTAALPANGQELCFSPKVTVIYFTLLYELLCSI